VLFSKKFNDQFNTEQKECNEQREKIWKEIQDFKRVCEEEFERITDFYWNIENYKFEEAISTLVLNQLIEKNFATLESKFITSNTLENKCTVWTMKWPDPIILDVEKEGEEDWKTKIKYNIVELNITIKNDLVDTEFFLLNPNKDFDDREKLHIIWKLIEKKKNENEKCEEKEYEWSLVYLGIGTNEPYRDEHPERGSTEVNGRPRFYIYDSVRNCEMQYRICEYEMGNFDWEWAKYPQEIDSVGNQIVYVVEFLRLARWCISDPVVMHACTELTLDKAFEIFAKYNQWPEKSYEELIRQRKEEFSSAFVLKKCVITREEKASLPEKPPTLEEVFIRVQKDYICYFAAFAVKGLWEKNNGKLRRFIDKLGEVKANYYRNLFSYKLRDIVNQEFLGYITSEETLEDIFLNQSLPQEWPQNLKEEIVAWKTMIADNIRRDLYHFGLLAGERMANLMFAVYLATNKNHGNMYKLILDNAKQKILGKEFHGKLDVVLQN